jgi:hypothetical protein
MRRRSSSNSSGPTPEYLLYTNRRTLEGSTEEHPLDSRGHIRGEVLAVKGDRVGP